MAESGATVTSGDGDVAPETTLDPQWGRVEEAVNLYVDALRIGTNFYSFALEMGVADPRQGGNSLLAIIRMSPQHAKIMSLSLSVAVDKYEKSTGFVLPVPQDLLDRWGIIIDDEGAAASQTATETVREGQ